MTDRKEVGVRIPAHPVPPAIASLAERPIINTSAKISGEEVLTDPRHIEKIFKGAVDIIIDGGIIISEPSTIVRLVDDEAEILREGKGIFTATADSKIGLPSEKILTETQDCLPPECYHPPGSPGLSSPRRPCFWFTKRNL